jgi:hypothetical protein
MLIFFKEAHDPDSLSRLSDGDIRLVFARGPVSAVKWQRSTQTQMSTRGCAWAPPPVYLDWASANASAPLEIGVAQ